MKSNLDKMVEFDLSQKEPLTIIKKLGGISRVY